MLSELLLNANSGAQSSQSFYNFPTSAGAVIADFKEEIFDED